MNKIRDLSKYKGLLVIGTARSGSHMACDMMYNSSTITNKINLYEVTQLPNPDNTFPFFSIVGSHHRSLLSLDLSWARDFYIVNIRRRDKIAQYLSQCVLKAQIDTGIPRHTPLWDEYRHYIPRRADIDDINYFIMDQWLDLAFNPNQILYYEDIVNSGIHTVFTKNQYQTVQPTDIVQDYELVKRMLSGFSYNNR